MGVLKGELNSTSTYVPAQLTKDKLLLHLIDTLTKINVKIDKFELATFYWLPKVHKNPFNIFLYSYKADFIQSLLSTGKKHLASRFNFTYRYIDDVLSINNPEFEHYLGQMYPAELEIKDTTESTTSASYLDLLLSIGMDGQLHTSIYDKRDDFNFHITNFPFLSSNIPSSPAYGVFISQLIRYARACSSY